MTAITKAPSGTALAEAPSAPAATALALSALDPTTQAAATAAACYRYATGEELDLSPLVAALAEQVDLAAQGNLARGEATLAVQATILNELFHALARRAMTASFFETAERYFRLAFRAQSQSRVTWEALAAMKNPPMAGYLQQTNIANGPQQVINAPTEPGESPLAGNCNSANRTIR